MPPDAPLAAPRYLEPMAIPQVHTVRYRVRFDEAGADGRLRASGFLRFAQDCAWQHSEAAGFDRDWYAERGLGWLVRCVELQLRAPVDHGASVDVTTRIVGWRRVWARRLTIFRAAQAADEADDLGHALTDWVLLDARGRPASIPPRIARQFTDGAAPFTPARVTLPPTPPGARCVRWQVADAEVDPMGHANNAAYVDHLDEALGPDALAEVVRGYRLEYLRPAAPGAQLQLASWPLDSGSTAYRLADGADELLRAVAWSGEAVPAWGPNSRS